MIGVEQNDDFSLGIADNVRARCATPGEWERLDSPFIDVALGLSAFIGWLGCSSLPHLTGLCCRELVREFRNQRLEQVQEETERQNAFPGEFSCLVKPMCYVVLTLEILITSAAKACPESSKNSTTFLRPLIDGICKGLFFKLQPQHGTECASSF